MWRPLTKRIVFGVRQKRIASVVRLRQIAPMARLRQIAPMARLRQIAPVARCGWVRAASLLAVVLPVASVPAHAATFSGGPCGPAIAAAEARHGLPPGLLRAVAEVESGRTEPRTGAVVPWPWTTNAENQDQFFASREDAVIWVRAAQARGIESIDVGCLQINLKQHPDAFASLEDAFDPRHNAEYAASFMVRLRAVSADWTEAVGWYHSHTALLAVPYRVQVARSYLGDSQRRPATTFATAVMARRASILQELAQAWSATLPATGTGAPSMPATDQTWGAASTTRPLAPGMRATGVAARAPRAKPSPGTASAVVAAAAAGAKWTNAAELAWDTATLAPHSAGKRGVVPREIATNDPGGP